MIDTRGNLYGTTVDGGAYGYGTVFKLTPLPAMTIMLSSSPNPSIYEQAITFTAVVTSDVETPPDGETVAFLKGTTVLGAGTLNDGSASFTTSTLPVRTNVCVRASTGLTDVGDFADY
jgi:uncharacterized repeat protein (TIGR03803 family)